MTEPIREDLVNRIADLAVALGCLVGSTALLVGVGHAAAVAAPDDLATPGFGQAVWWWSLAVLVVQAGLLVALRPAPRVVLVAVAAAVPVLALVGAGDATSFGALAVLIASSGATLRHGLAASGASLGAAVVLVGLGSALSTLSQGVAPGVAWGTGLLQAVVVVGLPAAVALFVRARRGAHGPGA
ncbi:hypothetical protein ACFQBY_00215 [Promicromonospora citrea]|uniref:hypothetical protein n=1 Tax=Promicromonospora citrea TaxID=43677 RepID=UPI00361E4CC8